MTRPRRAPHGPSTAFPGDDYDPVYREAWELGDEINRMHLTDDHSRPSLFGGTIRDAGDGVLEAAGKLFLSGQSLRAVGRALGKTDLSQLAKLRDILLATLARTGQPAPTCGCGQVAWHPGPCRERSGPAVFARLRRHIEEVNSRRRERYGPGLVPTNTPRAEGRWARR